MNNRTRFMVMLVATLMLIGAITQVPVGAANHKQLAAPPEDILSGRLALPAPADAAIRSQNAMIPVYLTPSGAGTLEWRGEILLDSSEDTSLMVFSPLEQQWRLSLADGGLKAPVTLDRMAARRMVEQSYSSVGIGNNNFIGKRYDFLEPMTGRYRVTVKAAGSEARGTRPHGYLYVVGKSPYRISSHLAGYDLLTGREVGLVTYAYVATPQDGSRCKPAALKGAVSGAEMRIMYPNGQEDTVKMMDDGAHNDGAAGDGVYGALITATQPGDYMAQVTVRGVTPAGQAFVRTTEHMFPVLEPRLTLPSQSVTAEVNRGTRMGINLQAVALGDGPGNVRVSAEVWGMNKNDEPVPVAWVGGIVTPRQAARGLLLPLSLDARWISRAAARPPFRLRHIVVRDVNSHIPLARLDSAGLDISREFVDGVSAVTGEAVGITEDMLKGTRPENRPAEENQSATSAAGGKLMLVHGYCSEGVWPTGHFTNYAVFSDHNQNRTHDYFAQLIASQGSAYPSFGVVAHSQGGCASLHLYTYYWSGLDYATGSRLIQSVGSPYQGTALAGNLALLGEIFGIGCGTNWDLTYDGASLWLSGIPSWARAKIYYHTTAFEDVAWRYDYCNLASDPFLSDPDDGVVEKWSGQLSGANNMGHKSGWCHTSSMRDPGQCTDQGRNSNMNAYACR